MAGDDIAMAAAPAVVVDVCGGLAAASSYEPGRPLPAVTADEMDVEEDITRARHHPHSEARDVLDLLLDAKSRLLLTRIPPPSLGW